MRLPDLIIGGAPRSGTTWLYRVLDRHPGIEMAKPLRPEPKFFLDESKYQCGLKYYSKTWFAGIGQDKVAGEKSTNYLESRVAAVRIRRDLPRVKLIFLLRNPVDRAFSNYRWSCMNGMEKKDFATALELETEREKSLPDALKIARPHAYFSRGLYYQLLDPYLKSFPREQILCLLFEDIRDQPRAIADRVHRFLGVDPRPQDAEGLGRVNASESSQTTSMPAVLRKLLQERYRRPNRQLADLLGSDSSFW